MNNSNWWKWATMMAGIALAGLAALAAEPRSNPKVVTSSRSVDDAGFFRGSGSCAGTCHETGAQNPKFITSQGYIKLDEYATWNKIDKHSKALINLTKPGSLGSKMAERLNLKDRDVTKLEAGCIGCHGAGVAEMSKRGDGPNYDPSEGVSCENCHGPESGWVDHTLPKFRNKTPKERDALQLNNLQLPNVQAAQCLTCHIGNSGEGKVVTHEMYAAGHPPLPSIEVATFSDQMPRHWLLVGEKKSQKVRKEAGFVEGTKERTRLALVGASVALKTSMDLLATETKADGMTTVPGLAWPDYARFDCWSCHHDLKRESWRQARGYEAAPGRPPISEWPLAIVDLGISRLELDDPAAKVLHGELEQHRKAVLDEANARPYGRKAGMATAAEQFGTWCNVLINRLASASYTEETSLELLKILVKKSLDKVSSYDEARHIAWTIKILAEDARILEDEDKQNPKWVADPRWAAERPAIVAVMKKFETGLKLKLPARQSEEIEANLEKALQVIGDYEPSQFQADLQELAKILSVPSGA